jgi:hypothetical protein
VLRSVSKERGQAMQVTFFHINDTPLEKGSQIELLGDGKILANATVGDGGVASFDAETEGVNKFAVRIASSQQAPADAKT